MKRRLQPPRNPLLTALPWLLAAAAVAGCYLRVRRLDGEPVEARAALTNGPIAAAAVRAVERQWVEEAFPPLYLPAPVSYLPCPAGLEVARPLAVRISEALSWVEEGRLDDAVAELGEIGRGHPSNWVPGLALGTLLAREGRLAEAETVLAALYQRRQAAIRQAVETAARNRAWDGPPTEDVLGDVHLLHAYGYVLIATHRGGEELWRALKNPIGCAKLLALRGATDRMRRLPTWAEHRLGAPGCEPAQYSLTTLDLYNNLIVGYLENSDFRDTPERRQRELARDYDAPPHRNPLLAVLRAAARDFPSESFPAEREHWLWAVSNAERLLEQRSASGTGELGNVRLAYNLAAVMESALPGSPREARDALRRQKNGLLAVARAGREKILPAQQPAFHRGLARLELLEAVRAGGPTALPEELAADLEAAQSEAARAVMAALGHRRAPDAWLDAVAAPGDALRAALGERAAPWLVASRSDFAATLAERAAAAPAAEKPWWARRARGVLEPGDEKPAELAQLEAELGLWWRLAPRRLLASPAAAGIVAALAGALAWLLGTWLAVQLGQRRDLVTSFYRLEARDRLRRRG